MAWQGWTLFFVEEWMGCGMNGQGLCLWDSDKYRGACPFVFFLLLPLWFAQT